MILPWKLVQICCPPTRAAADSDLVCLLQNPFTIVSRMQLYSLSKTRNLGSCTPEKKNLSITSRVPSDHHHNVHLSESGHDVALSEIFFYE